MAGISEARQPVVVSLTVEPFLNVCPLPPRRGIQGRCEEKPRHFFDRLLTFVSKVVQRFDLVDILDRV